MHAVLAIWRRLLPVCVALCVLPAQAVPVAGGGPDGIRIGVLAYRGKAQALERWQPTADYLSAVLPGRRFRIVPLDLDELPQAIADARIQFTLTNPGHYVDLETRFGISRIATLRVHEAGQARVRYGAVIVARADNPGIRGLADLRGKSFMAVSADAFGGFQMAWLELKAQGIDPFEDFASLSFAGFPQDAIIAAVNDGRVDAATVRARTLAQMIDKGEIAADALRVLNAQHPPGAPFPVSTRLYPEWPFATLSSTPMRLAAQVARALLSMPEDHPAARASQTAGWTVPLDYSPVHDLMRELQTGPYAGLRQATLSAFVKRYAHWFAGAAVLLLALVLLNGYVSRTNRRLRETERNLRHEIHQRRRSQQILASYRDTLEQQVAERTNDLSMTNRALERSRVALRELVRITVAPELNHDEKLAQLLDAGRAYFKLPMAVLASVQGDGRCLCLAGDGRAPDDGRRGPLSATAAARVTALHGEALDIPDLWHADSQDRICLAQGWRSYLGAAVLVEGQVHCTLEFAGRQARQMTFSPWDHDLLKVMAQWIGDELERRIAYEAQQQHQAELARVSRMSSIGELAASLAHELNQPLTGAINYASGCLRLLRAGESDTVKLAGAMERAVEGARMAADIIRQVREFVQKGDVEPAPVDLNRAVREVSALVDVEARHHGVSIRLDLAGSLPPVQGNLIQLEQVILNFVRNAIDAIDSAGARERRLTLATRCEGERVCLRATDTGEGLSEESLARVFDAFYTTKSDGVGIGLSISRSIIESHQGRIMARSAAGGGAEFSFELPVHADV